MPGDLPDVILVVLAAAFAVEGYRQGFVVGALGVIGFLGGAAAGAVVSAGVIVTDGRQAHYPARVVYFDPRRDIAVLYVPGLHARPLHFAAGASPGSDAIVAGHPLGMPLMAAPARIGAKTAIGFPTIYVGGR